MSIFGKLFGHSKNGQTAHKEDMQRGATINASLPASKKLVSHADPRHPAFDLIREALAIADVADAFAQAHQRGCLSDTSTDIELTNSLVEAFNRASEAAPEDVDLLVAKYAALSFTQRDGNECLDKALALDPQHFDAQMLRDHPKTWKNLFFFPSWSEERKTLNQRMMQLLLLGQPIHIVRDGLSLSIAVVINAQADTFPCGIRRTAWKLFWAKTPYGSIACHYVLLDCGPDDIRLQEFFIPHTADDSPSVLAGYWILRRLPHLRSCFVVFTENDKVLHNIRYDFPISLQSDLQEMDNDLKYSGPVADSSSCQAAINWYSQNTNLDSVTF